VAGYGFGGWAVFEFGGEVCAEGVEFDGEFGVEAGGELAEVVGCLVCFGIPRAMEMRPIRGAAFR
jgi:hypothetical protein